MVHFKYGCIIGGRDKNFEDPMQSDQDIGGGGFLGATLLWQILSVVSKTFFVHKMTKACYKMCEM